MQGTYGQRVSPLGWITRHTTALLAVKAGVAAGLAFWVGSLLPAPLDEYKYYAALGAYTVIGLIVVDSVKESLRVLGAVGVGVGTAVAVQMISWTNAFSVASAIMVCVVVSALPLLGEQRSWAPLAALFVLATGGAHPTPMALAYIIQIPVGAAIGITINLVLLAPLGDRDLRQSTTRVRLLIVRHMHTYADLLEDQEEEPADEAAVSRRTSTFTSGMHELERAQAQLLAAMSAHQRGQWANPRARVSPGTEKLIQDQAEAISRCAAALGAVTVLLGEADPDGHRSERQHQQRIRQDMADVLRRSAEIFDRPEKASQDTVGQVTGRIDRITDRVRSTHMEDGLDNVLFGALALSVRRCLNLFAHRVVGVE